MLDAAWGGGDSSAFLPQLSGNPFGLSNPVLYSWESQANKNNSLFTYWAGVEAVNIFDIGSPPVAIEVYTLGNWRGNQDIVGDCDLEGRGKYIVIKMFSHHFRF